MAPTMSERTAVTAIAPRTMTRKRRPAASQMSRLLLAAGSVGQSGCARGGTAHLIGVHWPALERVVAGGDVTTAERIERWILHVAVPFLEPRAARMEAAAARRIDRARNVALEHD